MSVESTPRPAVATGAVIATSMGSVLRLVAVGWLVSAVAAFALWDRFAHSPEEPLSLPFLPFRLTWWGILLAGVFATTGPLGLVVLIGELISPMRYVVGDECLQEIAGSSSDPHVRVQIPYANIADLRLEEVNGQRRIGIDLRTVADPKSYLRSGTFDVKKSLRGRHYVLDRSAHIDLDSMHQLLQERRARYLQKRPAP